MEVGTTSVSLQSGIGGDPMNGADEMVHIIRPANVPDVGPRNTVESGARPLGRSAITPRWGERGRRQRSPTARTRRRLGRDPPAPRWSRRLHEVSDRDRRADRHRQDSAAQRHAGDGTQPRFARWPGALRSRRERVSVRRGSTTLLFDVPPSGDTRGNAERWHRSRSGGAPRRSERDRRPDRRVLQPAAAARINR